MPLPDMFVNMASNNGTSIQFDVLIVLKMSVTVSTWRRFNASPRDVVVSIGDDLDGVYEHRVVPGSLSGMSEDIGEELLPEVNLPEFSFEIQRTDASRTDVDDLVDSINSNYGADVECVIYIKDASSVLVPANDLFFQGYVGPDGWEINADSVVVKVQSLLSKHDRMIPEVLYGDEYDEDEADADILDKPIPILYGDWTDRPSRWYLPCGIVQKLTKIVDGDLKLGARLCKPNSHGIKSFYAAPQLAWWRFSGGENHDLSTRNGTYPIISESAANGTFTLDRSRARDSGNETNVYAEGDTVHISGAKGNTHGDGSLYEEPAAIIYDLLHEYGGVSVANIDDSATPSGGTFKELGYRFRGYIDEQAKLITEICDDICKSAGLILYYKDGKIALDYHWLHRWEYWAPGAYVALNSDDVNKSQTHNLRPADFDYNGVRLRYRWNPSGETSDDFAETLTYGGSPYYEVESKWIWRDSDAITIASYWYLIVTGYVRTLEIGEAPNVGLDLGIGSGSGRQRVLWTDDGLTDQYYYMTKVERNLNSENAGASCRAIKRALEWWGGKWCPVGHPNYAGSTTAQKQEYGYWTNSSGLVPPGTTAYSHWE